MKCPVGVPSRITNQNQIKQKIMTNSYDKQKQHTHQLAESPHGHAENKERNKIT